MRGRLAAAVVTAGLLLIALNLRIGVSSVGPALTSIRGSLGFSATAASLLTTIPVVAFGAFAFLAPWLTRRLDMHQFLGLAMAALAAGIGLRRSRARPPCSRAHSSSAPRSRTSCCPP